MVRCLYLYTILALLLTVQAFCLPNYQVIIKNETMLNNNTFGFDVYVKSNESHFVLTSYQCVLKFECNDIYGDIFKFKYINQSSELKNVPNIALSMDYLSESTELKFASAVGEDTIRTTEERLGSFIVTRNGVFDLHSIKIGWNTTGDDQTILTDANFEDIADSSAFITDASSNQNVQLLVNEPTVFSLSQNYPNPFNPTTTIKYQIAHKDHVLLMVYNVLGQRVATLVDEIQGPGFKHVEFNGASLASGVYFYTLTVGKSFFDRRKMMLLK